MLGTHRGRCRCHWVPADHRSASHSHRLAYATGAIAPRLSPCSPAASVLSGTACASTRAYPPGTGVQTPIRRRVRNAPTLRAASLFAALPNTTPGHPVPVADSTLEMSTHRHPGARSRGRACCDAAPATQSSLSGVRAYGVQSLQPSLPCTWVPTAAGDIAADAPRSHAARIYPMHTTIRTSSSRPPHRGWLHAPGIAKGPRRLPRTLEDVERVS